MDKKIETQIQYIFFTVLILIQVFFLLFNSGSYGGADNITHFQIAKYSFNHPDLFLDLWGKPVYTTLLSPFTLFGFKIAKAFNLVAAVLTLLLLSKLSNKLSPGSSIVVIVLTAFAPVYFLLMSTCLTEVLFSFILVASVYLFVKDRLLLSAIVLSFIPFVRTEGYIFFPIFTFVFLLKRNYLSIPLLATGTVFYSFLGYFVFGDFLWIINKMPYSMGDSIYGSGSLFHFVKNSNFIFGVPFLVLLLVGLVFWSFQIIRKFSFKNEQFLLFILIVGSWLGYFAAHSYVWWKGTGGSLGLIRVIGGVIPLAALTCIKGIEAIRLTVKSKKIANGIVVSLSILQVVLLFTQTSLPIKADPTEQLISKSADYIRFNEANKKIYYYDPLLVHYLDIDPYDTKQCNWGVGNKQRPSNSMDWGDILVWDAHFGPNEGGVQLNILKKDSLLQEIKTFLPVEKIQVLGGYNYSIRIFKKVENRKENEATQVTNHVEKVLSFEKYSVREVVKVDSIKVWEMNKKQEFSPNIIFPVNEITRNEFLDFKVELQFKALESIGKDQVLLVFSVDNENNHLRYEKMDLISQNNDWQKLKMDIEMPATIPNASKVAVYVWNKDKKHFYIKNLIVNASGY